MFNEEHTDRCCVQEYMAVVIAYDQVQSNDRTRYKPKQGVYDRENDPECVLNHVVVCLDLEYVIQFS